jgi:hypothetical protein
MAAVPAALDNRSDMNARAQFAASGWLSRLSPFELESVEGSAGFVGGIAGRAAAGGTSGSADSSTPQQPQRQTGRIRLRRRHHLHRAGSEATVSVHVNDFAQLFNSLDPSPLWDRDLDRGVAQFIEDEFRDRRAAATWRLQVFAHQGVSAAADLQSAVETYYRRSARSARLALREHMKITRIALLGGASIFLLSTAVRSIIDRALAHPPQLLDQGLIVLAWLGLWRPIEALVYEWVPFYRKRRLYERLARIHVTVRSGTPRAAGGGTTPAGAASPEPDVGRQMQAVPATKR